MLGLFKTDPVKKLQKEYEALCEKAIAAQRKGDIRLFSDLTAQSEELAKKIDELSK
tara:strand:+ start:36 stop:203 length:168 start_codon:yes stop_codon:yes gene_type:complete